MKHTAHILTAAATLVATPSFAAIVQGDKTVNNGPGLGIGYSWTAVMDASETGVAFGHVGAWSWDEDGNPSTARGWTHTSHWMALELTEPAYVTILMEKRENVPMPSVQDPNRVAGFNLFPGMSIYQGWEIANVDEDANGVIDAADGPGHTYNNAGDLEWSDETDFLTAVPGGAGSAISWTGLLPAGQYSIAMGGNSPSTAAEGRQGYQTTVTTVPEPGSALLALAAGATLLARRRRA